MTAKVMAGRLLLGLLVGLLISLGSCALNPHAELQRELRGVCWPEDGETWALSSFVRSGEAGRLALVELAGSRNWLDADCGLGGLSMLADQRAIPAIVRRLEQDESDQNPREAVLSRALHLAVMSHITEDPYGLVAALAMHVGTPAGFYAVGTLGHIDRADAARVVAHALATAEGARLADAIFAAGVRGDAATLPIVREKMTREDIQEPARRRWVAFYLLAHDTQTAVHGFELIEGLPPDLKQHTAGWVIQTLCIRAERVSSRDAIDGHRRELIRQFDQRKIEWHRAPFVSCDSGPVP
jgi:hypothetical protein